MNNDKRGYYIYSTIVALFGFILFGFLAYFIYDLFIKLSAQDFSNNTVVQALLTLFITVFVGVFFKGIRKAQRKKSRTL